jgi:hypothetical protein
MSGKKEVRKKALSHDTLRRIMEEFPVYNWNDEEIGELVCPKHGVISGFEEMLDDVRALSEKDLFDIGPAGKPEKEIGKI